MRHSVTLGFPVSPSVVWRGSSGDFICANTHPRLAILCQGVVAAGQPQPLTKIKNAVHSKRLGTLPTATGAIARLAYSCAQRAGIEIAPLLRKAGLTDQQIKEQGGRFAVHNQIEFLNIIANALGDEFLGFHLAQLPDLRELGLIFYVAASSQTLGDALQRAARYSSIANEGLTLKCLRGGDIRMRFEYVGVARHSDRHQLEFLMTVLIRLCRQLTGLRLTPSRVRITHRRSKQSNSELAPYLGRNITFGAKADELIFAEKVNDITIKTADPYLNELLVANCERALAHRGTSRGAFQTTVENAIVPLLPHGKVRASEIATRLGVSQRTSARRLALEGMSFSRVLQNLRHDLAGQYLSDPDLSISRIAWLLGYHEISAFTHAFRRWFGKAPREARAQNFAAYTRASRTHTGL
jgi:AraC-like DNA-binding protein